MTQTMTEGTGAAGAVFSPCYRYRYRLWRVWDTGKPKICFVMLNPSKATHEILDPTVTRCKKRAEALKYGGFEVVNIFALRSTDPKALYKVNDPVGPENFGAILEAVKETEISICAWGGHGSFLNIGEIIRTRINQDSPGKAHYLKLNQDGSPTHPLYLDYKLKPVLWAAA